jgi:hypothetical protein
MESNYEIPDLFKRTQRGLDHTTGTGVPDLETMTILAIVKKNPGYRKGILIFSVREALGVEQERERNFLHYVDDLVNLGYLVRFDFGYHTTPRGMERLVELRNKAMPALRLLVMGDMR